MEWKDLGAIVGKAAPLLGSILTGNVPGAVLAGAQILGSVFGTEASPDAIHKAVAADPQAAVKLAEIEANNRTELQRLLVTAEANRLAAETAQYRIEVDDRQGARQREIATGSRMPAVLSIFLVLGFFAVLGAMLSGMAIIPKEYELMVGQLIGTLQSAVAAAIAYYIGSTKGSSDKNNIIRGLADAKS